jgi:NAD(P)H-quinone oxidoreductase subunit 5
MERSLCSNEDRIVLATLVALAGVSAVGVVVQTIHPRPVQFVGITFDRLSALLTLLVAAVGAITYRYSIRYLDGEREQPRFQRWLATSVVTAYLLMLSTNLMVLFAAWSATSYALHKLLTFYPERRDALAAARKKFLISRLGDVALGAAILIAWQTWQTVDLHVLFERIKPATESGSASLVACLVVIAALTKSAQFPFHSWLPETMESPTPVSAIMHAGIINGGGALLLRFAPLITQSATGLALLVLTGTLTCALGMISMWAQVKVKRTLAWSTVSQMGFMMVQCGLAAFPAAALHIVGHGLYKAFKFLRSGELPAAAPARRIHSPKRHLALVALGTIVALPVIYGAAWLFRFNLLHEPGEAALCAIVALSIGQAWAAIVGSKPLTQNASVLIALTIGAALLACGLYRLTTWYLAPVIGYPALLSTPAAWALSALPVVTMIALAILHALLPILSQTAFGTALRVHALHGFYLGAVADRFVEQLFNSASRKDVSHA